MRLLPLIILLLAGPVGANALQPQPVAFNAADGFRISADYYPPPPARDGKAPFVMLLHAVGRDRTSWEPLIGPLHEVGFAVLALDLRGHGQSATTATRDRLAQRDHSLFREMENDLRGAYDWLAQRTELDRSRFAIVGASIGASLAFQYAVCDVSVDVVVCLSPGLNYMGIDSAGDIGQLRGRQILMVATADERDAPYTLQQRASHAQVRIHNRDRAHGTDMFAVVPHLTEDIVKFLREGVGQPSTNVVCGSVNSNIYHRPGSGWIDRIAPTNLRYYSSPAEAEARGLRASRSRGPRSRSGGNSAAGG